MYRQNTSWIQLFECWVISHAFLRSTIFFQNYFFQLNPSGSKHGSRSDLTIQARQFIQTVCKRYQQMTLDGKKLLLLNRELTYLSCWSSIVCKLVVPVAMEVGNVLAREIFPIRSIDVSGFISLKHSKQWPSRSAIIIPS